VDRRNEYWRWCGRNSEFCITAGPVTRTAGLLIQSVKGTRLGLYARLIAFNPQWFKSASSGIRCHATHLGLYFFFFFFLATVIAVIIRIKQQILVLLPVTTE